MQWARESEKWLLCVIMAACTTLAVICLPGWVCKNGGMTMHEIAAVCLEMLSAHKIWAVCLWLGLGATYRRYVLGAAFSWRAAALSWLWSLLMSVGWMTEKADRLRIFLTEPGHGMLPVFLLVGAWPGLYALVRGLDMGLDGSGLQSEKGKMRWTAAGRAAVLLLCWAPYLMIAFPGSVEADFGPALLSFYGEAAFSSQLPLFVTLLFGGTVRAFDMLGIPMAGVALYNIAQMTALAFIVGTMLQMMQKNGISGRAVMAAMAIYALLPVFPLYAMTASKDNLFSICVMAALLHLCRAILEGERAFSAKWRYAALGVSLALVGVVRNAGIYLVPVIGAAMLLACRARWKQLLAVFAAAGILLGMWYGAVVPQFGVQPGGTLENMSLML